MVYVKNMDSFTSGACDSRKRRDWQPCLKHNTRVMRLKGFILRTWPTFTVKKNHFALASLRSAYGVESLMTNDNVMNWRSRNSRSQKCSLRWQQLRVTLR